MENIQIEAEDDGHVWRIWHGNLLFCNGWVRGSELDAKRVAAKHRYCIEITGPLRPKRGPHFFRTLEEANKWFEGKASFYHDHVATLYGPEGKIWSVLGDQDLTL